MQNLFYIAMCAGTVITIILLVPSAATQKYFVLARTYSDLQARREEESQEDEDEDEAVAFKLNCKKCFADPVVALLSLA